MPKFKVSLPLLFDAEFNIEIDKTNIKVAWNIFCELQTRVGIVDFAENEDIINVCFESWYNMFKVIRSNLKDLQIPLKKRYDKKESDKKKSKRKKANNIVYKSKNLDEVLFVLLNSHMRPFLRKWHYEFVTYWRNNFIQNKNPIEVQKQFPNYTELIADIKILQEKLKQTSDALEQIVKWSKERFYLGKIWFSLKILLIIIILTSLILIYLKIILPFLNF